jgi:hypothetical protein
MVYVGSGLHLTKCLGEFFGLVFHLTYAGNLKADVSGTLG